MSYRSFSSVSRRSASASAPSASHWRTVTTTPCVSRRRSGRMEALCSMLVVRTRIPGFRYPLRTMLSASVTLDANVTYRGSAFSWPPKSAASFSRQLITISIVPISRFAAAPRARFAPARVMKSYTARATGSGLGHVVAALFRYTAICITPVPMKLGPFYHEREKPLLLRAACVSSDGMVFRDEGLTIFHLDGCSPRGVLYSCLVRCI